MSRAAQLLLLAGALSTALSGRAGGGTGDLDPNFGTVGGTTVSVGAEASGATGVILPDGRIVAIGTTAAVAGGDPHIFLARFESDGTLDATFGAGGVAVSDVVSDRSFFPIDARLQGEKILVVASM